jgi:hypothetical protein
MYTVRLSIPDGFGDGQAQIVHDTGSYATSGEAQAEFDTWLERLITASHNGLLEIRDSPGWLRLELVDYTDTSESDMPDGWVMDVHLIWQRFASDTEPDTWLPDVRCACGAEEHTVDGVSVIPLWLCTLAHETEQHPVKPVWCDECDAWHVECEEGCCTIEV